MKHNKYTLPNIAPQETPVRRDAKSCVSPGLLLPCLQGSEVFLYCPVDNKVVFFLKLLHYNNNNDKHIFMPERKIGATQFERDREGVLEPEQREKGLDELFRAIALQAEYNHVKDLFHQLESSLDKKEQPIEVRNPSAIAGYEGLKDIVIDAKHIRTLWREWYDDLTEYVKKYEQGDEYIKKITVDNIRAMINYWKIVLEEWIRRTNEKNWKRQNRKNEINGKLDSD